MLRIIYPYNEILPTKRAHDVFIFHQCQALAESGHRVTLLCGEGSKEKRSLFQHYEVADSKDFHIKTIPIIRKNNLLNLSWNLPFFYFTQRFIRSHVPDVVFLSVLKQGIYHLSRKVPSVRYIYEVHELSHYPSHQNLKDSFQAEHSMLKQADLITVTTSALKEILNTPPYSLKVPIQVIPLAVQQQPLPPPPGKDTPLVLMYVGQLYSGQGISDLLFAMKPLSNVCLKVIGGKPDELAAMNRLVKQLDLSSSIEFLGFHPPLKATRNSEGGTRFCRSF